MSTAEATEKRQYRSTLRQQQAATTKRAVIDAARELFLTQGWAGTGMREVAAAAGVALETVYSHFSSKKGLLRAVVDVAVTGDDAPVPLAGRAEFQAAGEGARPARIAAAARVVSDVHTRTAAMAKLVREAAHADPEMAQMLRATRDRQRLDVAAALELVVGRKPTDDECDGVWALTSPEVYLLLVEESGWAPARYRQWIEQMLERAVPLA